VKVLLIEDNPENADTFTRVLNLLKDAEITHMPNGIDGLRAARTGSFDVILIDFDLPDLHGTQIALTLATLMRRGRLPLTPLIALTARADEPGRRHAARVGFDAFVGKPCEEQDLLRLIRQLTFAPEA
jgi:CheY-like chemotaxis protein